MHDVRGGRGLVYRNVRLVELFFVASDSNYRDNNYMIALINEKLRIIYA